MEPKVRVLTEDEVDDLLASTRATDERERKDKRRAQERLAAKRDAQHRDATAQEKLDRVTETRNRALEIIRRYDVAADEAVNLLGPDHPVSHLLLDAKNPPRG